MRSIISVVFIVLVFSSTKAISSEFYSEKYFLEVAQADGNASRLRKIIGELRRGTPDYESMAPTLRVAVKQQLPAVRSRLLQLGEVVSISYEGQQNGADVYGVTFQHGSSVWMMGDGSDGKLTILWFQ